MTNLMGEWVLRANIMQCEVGAEFIWIRRYSKSIFVESHHESSCFIFLMSPNNISNYLQKSPERLFQDALLGRVHWMETGELVYLTTAGDLLGRGIGQWIQEGQAIAFQLDIFQYEAPIE